MLNKNITWHLPNAFESDVGEDKRCSAPISEVRGKGVRLFYDSKTKLYFWP